LTSCAWASAADKASAADAMRTRLIIEIPPKDDANRRSPSAAGFGPDTRAKAGAVASEWDAPGATFRRICRENWHFGWRLL
jgi:hypothetical protein